ncbi:MAG: hypothetical protein KAH26_04830, partial [Bacteroidales bacterium]|nr:hypothetical protein [Bacteroidales bacterium]
LFISLLAHRVRLWWKETLPAGRQGTKERAPRTRSSIKSRHFKKALSLVPKSTFVGLEENKIALNFELSDIYPNPATTNAQFNR